MTKKLTEKRCCRCKETKPISHFQNHKDTHLRCVRNCIECKALPPARPNPNRNRLVEEHRPIFIPRDLAPIEAAAFAGLAAQEIGGAR